MNENIGCLTWIVMIFALLGFCTVLDKLFGLGGVALIAITVWLVYKRFKSKK